MFFESEFMNKCMNKFGKFKGKTFLAEKSSPPELLVYNAEFQNSKDSAVYINFIEECGEYKIVQVNFY